MGGRGTNSKINPLAFIDNNPKLSKAVDKVFDRVNLEGIDSDIYNHMFRYKIIRDLPEEQQDLIYDYIARRAGF